MTFAYTVRSEAETEETLRAWSAWLQATHLPEVVSAGALKVELVHFDGKHLECRYQFESREAFARYERDHAPTLRADALAKFPPSSGLTMSRTTGDIVFVSQRPVR